MEVLALEPYYGGSHRAFLDGWSARSRHRWTVLSLPAHNWKWRMRHAAVTFAEALAARAANGKTWDVLVCSDMLDLAAFRGLAGEAFRSLPNVVYFHESQLTYPVRREEPHDRHFAFTNLTTALAATAVWFNSAFHRGSFLAGIEEFLRRMPDRQPLEAVEALRAKSVVHEPGVDEFPARGARARGPMRLLWAARWEHDKGPETFLEALRILADRGPDFRLSVIGQQFREAPACFDEMRSRFAPRIDRWGCQPTREAYAKALGEADVFVSTARHEFFGISAVEAMAAGAYPLLPNRLAYPEVVGRLDPHGPDAYLYDGTAESLAARLAELCRKLEQDRLWHGGVDLARRAQERFGWSIAAPRLDEALATAPETAGAERRRARGPDGLSAPGPA